MIDSTQGNSVIPPLKTPDAISLWEEAAVVREAVYPVKPRSLVILFARITDY